MEWIGLEADGKSAWVEVGRVGTVESLHSTYKLASEREMPCLVGDTDQSSGRLAWLVTGHYSEP
jgi:hypothetical protein